MTMLADTVLAAWSVLTASPPDHPTSARLAGKIQIQPLICGAAGWARFGWQGQLIVAYKAPGLHKGLKDLHAHVSVFGSPNFMN